MNRSFARSVLAFLLLAAFAYGASQAQAQAQTKSTTTTLDGSPILMSEASYRCAFEDFSTNNYLVLVRIVNEKAQASRWVCVAPRQVLDAVLLEQGLERGKAGRDKAMEIALKQEDRTFRFTNEKAFATASPEYTEGILAEVREGVKGMKSEDVVRQLDNQSSSLYKLAFKGRGYPSAMLHTLAEKGYACGLGCIPGKLVAEPPKMAK